jgi:hypothetical protein
MSSYLIRRDDGISDGIAGQVFDSYDAAYAVVERYYADMCCSDDREYYRIVGDGEQAPWQCPGRGQGPVAISWFNRVLA